MHLLRETDMAQNNIPQTPLVHLKNCEQVPTMLVNIVMKSLKELARHHPVTFRELITACRNRKYVMNRFIMDASPDILTKMKLVEGYTDMGYAHINDFTRKVILLAVEGEGSSLRIVSPFL
jgi:hypothetical protein